MKTPHTIELLEMFDQGLNPDIGRRFKIVYSRGIFNCLFTWVKEAKVFEEYGSRTERIGIARFNNQVPHFTHAQYQDHYFVVIETIDMPIKNAVRLKEVSYDDVFSN